MVTIGINYIQDGTEFAVLLYDHKHISHEIAVSAIKQTHASKRQKRLALTVLENLKRQKES